MATIKKQHNVRGRYECDLCWKIFSFQSGLYYHQKVEHETIKTGQLLSCLFCGKLYGQKEKLEEHSRTHTKERPYFCKICGTELVVKKSLTNHLKLHQNTKRERKFKCELCSKAFFLSHHLRNHLQTHTGEKPFKCGWCKKSFVTKPELQRHEFVHSGIQRFNCEICQRKFKIQGDLQRHMFQHTGEKPYKCEFCSESFTHLYKCKNHVAKKH